MNDGRNMYLDLFGIGLMLTIFFEENIKWVLIGTFGLVTGIKFFEVVMSEYYGRKAIQKNRKSMRQKNGAQLQCGNSKEIRSGRGNIH